MIDWIKRKAAMLSLAMANVEKNSLSQIGDSIESNVNQERRHTQGTLLDGMIHGELTQEVMDKNDFLNIFSYLYIKYRYERFNKYYWLHL